MSVKDQIDRLSDAKDAIASAIENKGVTVASTTKLDGMATLINAIDTGGKVTSVNGQTGDVTGAQAVADADIAPASVDVGGAVSLDETSDGRGVIKVKKADGTLAVQTYANTGSAGGEVDVFDSSGAARGMLYVATTGNGVLRLYNSNGSYATLTPTSIGTLNSIVDYIVAQGTSGVWRYRKWNSGWAECWANVSHTGASTDWLQLVVTLPFTFVSRNYAQITATGDGGWAKDRAPYDNTGTGAYSKTQVTITYRNASSDSIESVFAVYVCGNWK